MEKCKHFWYVDGEEIQCVYCKDKHTRYLPEPSKLEQLVNSAIKTYCQALMNVIIDEGLDREEIIASIRCVSQDGISFTGKKKVNS